MNHRDVLVRAVEKVAGILETRPQDLSGSIYVSPQQPLGDLVQPLWHYRKGRFVQLRRTWMMFAADGPLEKLAKASNWFCEFAEARSLFQTAFAALNCVRYFGSEVPVQLGDHVSLRVLFRKTAARVSYLPGVSPANPNIDFGGLFRVGLAYGKAEFVACHVDPDTLDLDTCVHFVSQDSASIPTVPSAEELNK